MPEWRNWQTPYQSIRDKRASLTIPFLSSWADGGIGRRAAFRTLWVYTHEGSSPSPPTQIKRGISSRKHWNTEALEHGLLWGSCVSKNQKLEIRN